MSGTQDSDGIPRGLLDAAPVSLGRVDTDAITRTAGRGALWRGMGSFWSMAVLIGASAVLARKLSQSDFGIFSMALVARNLIQRISVEGMSQGLIAKKDLTDTDICTAFWSMLPVKAGMVVIAFAAAPLAGLYFHEPRVVNVLRAVCLSFLLVGLGTVSNALLARRMRFGVLALLQGIGSFIASGTSVALVLVTDIGYWALVVGTLAEQAFLQVSIFLAAGWWPKLRFSRASLGFHFRFGAYGLGGSLAGWLDKNLDYLFVGRLLGAGTMGLYQFAYSLPHKIHTSVSGAVGAVLLPGYSQAQSSRNALGRGLLKATRLLAILTWPICAGLAALAHPAVAVLWGDKWLAVVPALQILCVSAAMNSLHGPSGAIFLACHRPDLPFKLQLVRTAIAIPAVIGLGLLLGFVGVAIAMSAAALFFFVVARRATRLMALPYTQMLRALAPAAIISGVVFAAARAASIMLLMWGAHESVALGVGTAAGLAGGLVVALAVFPRRVGELREIARTVLSRRRRSTGNDAGPFAGGASS